MFVQIEDAAPQSVMFLLALLGSRYATAVPDELDFKRLGQEMAFALFDLAKTPRKRTAWNTLLRSQQFFDRQARKSVAKKKRQLKPAPKVQHLTKSVANQTAKKEPGALASHLVGRRR